MWKMSSLLRPAPLLIQYQNSTAAITISLWSRLNFVEMAEWIWLSNYLTVLASTDQFMLQSFLFVKF